MKPLSLLSIRQQKVNPTVSIHLLIKSTYHLIKSIYSSTLTLMLTTPSPIYKAAYPPVDHASFSTKMITELGKRQKLHTGAGTLSRNLPSTASH